MQELFDDTGHLLNILRLVNLIFPHEVRLAYSHLDIDQLFQHFDDEIIVEYLAVFFLLHLVSLSNAA